MAPHDRPPNPNYYLILGFLLGVILHVAFTLLWCLISWILIVSVPYFNRDYNFFLLGIPLVFIGIVQMLYLLPTYLFVMRKRKSEIGKGLIICAILTILLNASCFAGIANLPGLGIVFGGTIVVAIVSSLIVYTLTK